jgi:hypothetical protein
MTLKVSQVIGAAHHFGPIIVDDIDRIQFALNLKFLEAKFFLHGALGRGFDTIAPTFTSGGPPPVGAKKANLDPLICRIKGSCQVQWKNIFDFHLLYNHLHFP